MAYGEWPNGSRYCNRIRRFSVQTLLSSLPGIGSRPCHNAPGDPQVKKTCKTEWLTLIEWGYPLNNCPEMADVGPEKDISILAFVRVSYGNF